MAAVLLRLHTYLGIESNSCRVIISLPFVIPQFGILFKRNPRAVLKSQLHPNTWVPSQTVTMVV